MKFMRFNIEDAMLSIHKCFGCSAAEEPDKFQSDRTTVNLYRAASISAVRRLTTWRIGALEISTVCIVYLICLFDQWSELFLVPLRTFIIKFCGVVFISLNNNCVLGMARKYVLKSHIRCLMFYILKPLYRNHLSDFIHYHVCLILCLITF